MIALRVPQAIFDMMTQYAFAGFTSLAPLLVAALFWRRSTRWGALASTVWTAAAVAGVAVLQTMVPAPPPGIAGDDPGDRRRGYHYAGRERHDGVRHAAGRRR